MEDFYREKFGKIEKKIFKKEFRAWRRPEGAKFLGIFFKYVIWMLPMPNLTAPIAAPHYCRLFFFVNLARVLLMHQLGYWKISDIFLYSGFRFVDNNWWEMQHWYRFSAHENDWLIEHPMHIFLSLLHFMVLGYSRLELENRNQILWQMLFSESLLHFMVVEYLHFVIKPFQNKISLNDAFYAGWSSSRWTHSP